MTVDFNIRRMQPADSPALTELEEKTTDTGMVGFSTRYQYDYYPIQQALRTQFTGIVAEVPDREGLVGVGMMSFGTCQVEGELRPYAYFGGLGVHEDFRRMGIASALSARRIELARQQIGEAGIIIAGVQSGNLGSLKTAQKWANQTFEHRSSTFFAKTTSKPPRLPTGISVRLAVQSDLQEIADRQNTFYTQANLYPRKSSTQLQDWLAERPFGHEINRYYVAIDPQGNLLAGVGVTLEGFLITSHVVRMPVPLRIANAFLKLVPASGINKRLNGHWFWFQPGQEQAGSALWDSIAYLERDNATMCMLFYDQQGPVSKALVPPRFLPSSGGYLLVNSPVPLSYSKFLYFNNMMV